jgi:hypothetical protein
MNTARQMPLTEDEEIAMAKLVERKFRQPDWCATRFPTRPARLPLAPQRKLLARRRHLGLGAGAHSYQRMKPME